jgi:phosphorylase kinase alpha/beta subunit
MGKKLPSLALSLTDLIVRQKQVTVGLPGKEMIISRPHGAQELKDKIYSAHEGDVSTSSLSQEFDHLIDS